MTQVSQRVQKVSELTGALRSSTPPFPRSAKVELTARCDFQCYFCASHKHPRPAKDMSRALYERTARDLRAAGVDQLGLFYIGESFLCEWLPEAIRYAKNVCGFPYVFLTTNGSSATPERVRASILAGLDSLKFALNTASPEQFRQVTGVASEQYRSVVKNIIAARHVRDEVEASTGHRCTLTASSLAYDEEQRARMARVLVEIEPFVDEHYWLPLFGHCGLPGEHRPGHAPHKKPLPCWPLFTEAHITVDGHLSACSLDASPRFHMADLSTDTLTSAWHAPAFQALREAHLKGDASGTVCEHCIAYGGTE